jgi:hypothetical protein
MTLVEKERAIIHSDGYVNSTDHSQLHWDVNIYFLGCSQPMALTSGLQGIVICYVSGYFDGKSLHHRKQAAIPRVNSNIVAKLKYH